MYRSALERLSDHQTGIGALLAEVEPMLDCRDVAGSARMRWALTRALGAYQLFKHREMFDPMIAAAGPRDADRLHAMKDACLALGEEFRAYVQTWSSRDVAGCWAEYERATRAMIRDLRRHLARERHDVTALLEAPRPPPSTSGASRFTRPPAASPPPAGRPIPAG